MKKKQAINYSWPAVLSDFTQDNVNEKFSRCKLKAYFEGETADHRYFSESFCNKIIQTLPYTPVVSCYSEEDEDFIGHAKEQQIYGIVDPCAEITFDTDEQDRKWTIAEVVLYTERPDKVGEIAKKIIGQPHSLELDPKTVKYVINYDEKKHFKNIEFTDGSFVGLSVLGKNQKPAFTDSAFFSTSEFDTKINLLREYCESKKNQPENGGEKMNFEEFMKLSWGEISAKVDTAICKEYENDAYTYIIDMFEDSAIVRFYYFMERGSKLMRIKYTCDENGDVTLGDINEVHLTYEDVEEKEQEQPQAEVNMEQGVTEVVETETEVISDATTITTDDVVSDNAENSSETFKKDEDDKDDVDDVKDVDDDENDRSDDIDKDKDEDEEDKKDHFQTNSESAHDDNVEITPIQAKVSIENEQVSTIQEAIDTTGSTSFTEGERKELENLRREKKIGLVNSYKDLIEQEVLDNFLTDIDSFEYDSLELKLLKEYKRIQENNEKPIRAFTFAPMNNVLNNNNESPLDAFVRKNKR